MGKSIRSGYWLEVICYWGRVEEGRGSVWARERSRAFMILAY